MTRFLINLWASWCTPCVREMPALREAQQRYAQAQFLWINQQEKPEVALQAARGFGLPEAQVLLDPRNAMSEVAGSRALPTPCSTTRRADCRACAWASCLRPA